MKKKIMLAALAFVLLAIPAAWLQCQSGVMVDGRFFVQKNDSLYVNSDDSVSISRTGDDADIRIELDGEQLDAKLTVSANAYSFAYEDGRTVEGYAGLWTDGLVSKDGVPIWLEDSVVITAGNERSPSVLTREYSLSSILYQMVEGICEQRGHILVILMAMLIYALGVASFFWPEKVHFFGGRWMYANAELSDAGIAVQKISGVACAIVGVGLLYAPLLW